MGDLLLLRHGQSRWNALGRWQGQADPALSALGERQARHAAERLVGSAGSAAFDRVVSSDLRRAAATADAIASALGPVSTTREPGLRERGAGPWEGLTRAEIEVAWPGYLDSGERPPGFEVDAELLARAVPVLARLATGSGRVVVVSHAGVLRALERHLGEDRGQVPNLGGSWWYRDGSGLAQGDRVVLVPDDEITRPDET